MNEDFDNRADQANHQAAQRIAQSRPALTGCEVASVALGLGQGHLGHAGPPFKSAEDIPQVVLNALAGAVVHEGWAQDIEAGRALILDGKIVLHANHDLGTVSPMSGVVRPSQLLMRVEDTVGGGIAYATLAESGRKALRFGSYDADVARGLKLLDNVIGHQIVDALPQGGLEILPLIAQGLKLGDDIHQRNVGAMYAFTAALQGLSTDVRSWLLSNPQHFLNYAMAAAKVSLERACGIEGATIVTAISRNGHECAVKVAGAPNRWFTSLATQPSGYFFSPFTAADAQADLGDSAIVEAFGLGGATAHTAPELAMLMEQPWDSAAGAGRRMRQLFIQRHTLTGAALSGKHGLGLGLDARRVVALDEPVRIHTGIAHRDGVTGWIGIGVAQAPVECFAQALLAVKGR
jgi:hypothetical protein